MTDNTPVERAHAPPYVIGQIIEHAGRSAPEGFVFVDLDGGPRATADMPEGATPIRRVMYFGDAADAARYAIARAVELVLCGMGGPDLAEAPGEQQETIVEMMRDLPSDEMRKDVLDLFCAGCGSVRGEGLSSLMPGNRCPCSFD